MSSQELNAVILGPKRTDSANGAYCLELNCRLPALMALYQTQCGVTLDCYHFGHDLQDLIRRNGHVHYVIGSSDDSGRILGFATVICSNSLLDNIFPVNRFVVDEALSAEKRLAVSLALCHSLQGQAWAELDYRQDDICISVTFPKGADGLISNQPIFSSLEINGFHAVRTTGLAIWTAWLKQPPAKLPQAA